MALSATRVGGQTAPGAQISVAMSFVYGFPAFALAGPLSLIQFYFLNFATDVLLLAPATVGVMLAGARVWDAVSDPMAGYWSDRTRSRLGRRRSWMLASAPLVAVAFAALWSPPRALTPGELLAWSACAVWAFTTAATAWSIPHNALGAELSDDPNVRTRIFGLRFVCVLTGIVSAFGAMQWIVNAPDPRAAAAWLGMGAAVGMAIMLVVPPLAMRERPDHQGRGATSPMGAVVDVAVNPNARRLLFVWFVDQLGMAAQGAVAPYMAIYVLERPDLVGVLPVFYIVPMVLSVPLWMRVARRLGTRRTWSLSMFGAAAAYAGLFFLRADAFVMAAGLLAAAGFWSGCGGPLAPTLLAEVIDDDTRRTGERKEGVYFAAWNFVQKCSGALVVFSVGMSLQIAGFVPNVEQGPAVDLALRICLSTLPAAMFAIGGWQVRRLGLGDAPDTAIR